MSKAMIHLSYKTLLTILFSIALACPAQATDSPVPSSPIIIKGTDNNNAINYPAAGNLSVVLEKDAALSVTGEDAAIDLGHDGSVTLEAGAKISSKSDAESGPVVSGIEMDDDETEAGENQVLLEKGSGVSVTGTGDITANGVELTYSGSAHTTMNGANIKVSSENGGASGIIMDRIFDLKTAQLEMTGGSTIEVTGNSNRPELRFRAMEISDNSLYGVQIRNAAHGVVNLKDASQIKVTGKATGSSREINSFGAYLVNVEEAEVSLAGGSGISVDTSHSQVGGTAFSTGVLLGRVWAENTAKLTLENGSSIDAKATGSSAISIGTMIQDSPHAKIHVAEGSTISAISTAVTEASDPEEVIAGSAAGALGIQSVSMVEINLDKSSITSIMNSSATNTGTGNANAIIAPHFTGALPSGLYATGYDTAAVSLTDTTVSVTGIATAEANDGNSVAIAGSMDERMGFINGLSFAGEEDRRKLIMPEGTPTLDKSTAISLIRSTIDVRSTAKAAGQSIALASGINLENLGGEKEGDDPTLQLKDSTMLVSATATAPEGATATPDKLERDKGPAYIAGAIGIKSEDHQGATTMVLDHSTITAEATGPEAMAAGIMLNSGTGKQQIDLTNGTRITALSHATASSGEFPGSVAINLETENGEINIDATSSISGTYAIFDMSEGGGANVNNRGLISGRIMGANLHNYATGTLQAELGSDDKLLMEGPEAALAEISSKAFYFSTRGATLENGTTFCIVPTDNLGLEKEGDSAEFALLKNTDAVPELKTAEPTAPNWDQDQLKLKTKSPLLGLTWLESEEPMDNMLFVKAVLLSTSQAHISSNAEGAVEAAKTDKKEVSFLFGSNPEEWVPNVSGAFLSGMTRTVGTSQTDIGSRLGGLLGLNSGDEIQSVNGMWFNASFTAAEQSERDNVIGFDSDTSGYSLGYDRQYGTVTIGVAYTRGHTNADSHDLNAAMDMDDNLVSLYGSYDGRTWFGEAVLSAGFGDVDSTRRMDTETLTASYDSSSYNALVRAGMRINKGAWQILPVLSADYSYKEYDAYDETGGSSALHVDEQDYTVFNLGAGAGVKRSFVKSWGIITPEISGMLYHDLKGERISTTANFIGGRTSFVSLGSEPSETSWELSLSLTMATLGHESATFRIGYDYMGREDFSANSLSGKLRVEF